MIAARHGDLNIHVLARGCAGLLLLSCCSACSQKSTGPSARIEGSVNFQGQPVGEGSISFSPLERGKGVSASIVNGRYLAEAVPHGQVRVNVTAFRRTGKTVTLDGIESPQLESIVPDRLRRGVTIEVTGDRSDFDLNLSE